MMAAGGGPGAGFDRAPRMDIPIPDRPPYTAFVGQLSWEATEGDIADYFAPHKVRANQRLCLVA